jgi:predicted dehydrogenase
MEIIGTAGSLHLDRKAEAIDALLQEKFDCPRTFLNYKVFEEWQGAFPSAVRAFVYAIEHDTEPHVSARDGVRSTAVLDAIHRSLASGKPESIHLNV